MVNSKKGASQYRKKKGKGAIGLMANLLFNRGSRNTEMDEQQQRLSINDNRSSRRYDSHQNLSHEKSSPTNRQLLATSPVSPCKSPPRQFEGVSPPPIGLSGPTQFEFSPNQTSKRRDQSYLSFLSSHAQSLMPQSPSISGSPIRTMGGGTQSQNEKRLCVLKLKPFYETIDQMEEKCLYSGGNQYMDVHGNSIDEDIIEPILDPNVLMDDHVGRLLNTSLPLNRPNDYWNNNSNVWLSSPGGRSQFGSPVHALDDGINVQLQGRGSISLEERLRRERQRFHSNNGITQFCWTRRKFEQSIIPDANERNGSRFSHSSTRSDEKENLRLIVPLRGNIYVQDGVGVDAASPLRLLYDKSMLESKVSSNINRTNADRKGNHSIKAIVGRDTGAIDPQLSPDGSMVAFVVAGEIYAMSCGDPSLTVTSRTDESNYSEDGRNDCESNGTDVDIDSRDHIYNQLPSSLEVASPIRITFGSVIDDTLEEHDLDSSCTSNEACTSENIGAKKRYGRSITHGLADFIAQEEMDRYRGFFWNSNSSGILFVEVDESYVPPYRITHQGKDGTAGDEANYEDHRYPFAGANNPEIKLGYVPVDRDFILARKKNERLVQRYGLRTGHGDSGEISYVETLWDNVKWFEPPEEASEYLARVNWLFDGSACVQWQDRRQSKLILMKIDVETGASQFLHKEHSDVWINLHHMFKVLPNPIHPNECLEDSSNGKKSDFEAGSFSFLFASERTGYRHLYLYTFIPGDCSATLLRAVTAGEWMVDSIAGVDIENDLVYVTGTFDSPLERHLYALPLKTNDSSKQGANSNNSVLNMKRGISQVMNSLNGSSRKQSQTDHAPPVSMETPSDPIRLTKEPGMHSITMDEDCRLFVDTNSDINRPPSSKVYATSNVMFQSPHLLFVLYDASRDLNDDFGATISSPDIISFPTSDGSQTLYATLYRPDSSLHGLGPYPLICGVYGGPHVQRVNRSWSQVADMRAQRLCSMGFAVVKCDNRGSARRGVEFEGAIKNNLGHVEVLDQVAAVRHLVMTGIVDPSRVGIYGWSYGGYLAAMCLCRAPDVFHVGVAGAPVTSWDGYDTHYTERYMGIPLENSSGYQQAAIFQHVQNMRGKLMIIHGLIDENVHFRHTARLINHLHCRWERL